MSDRRTDCDLLLRHVDDGIQATPKLIAVTLGLGLGLVGPSRLSGGLEYMAPVAFFGAWAVSTLWPMRVLRLLRVGDQVHAEQSWHLGDTGWSIHRSHHGRVDSIAIPPARAGRWTYADIQVAGQKIRIRARELRWIDTIARLVQPCATSDSPPSDEHAVDPPAQ